MKNLAKNLIRSAPNNTDAKAAAVSGWGRYTRFMFKYVHPDNLYGLEVSPAMVEHCRKAFGMANFLKVETMPPSPLRSGLVDLVFGYSVFSHLAPHCADAWISEFARMTKPGGLVLMTTQGRSFIDFCRNIRESGDRSHAWFISLSKALTDSEQAYRDYDAGSFYISARGSMEGPTGNRSYRGGTSNVIGRPISIWWSSLMTGKCYRRHCSYFDATAFPMPTESRRCISDAVSSF